MPSPALLCFLVFLAGVGASRHQSTLSEDNCTHFSVSLPHMLRELRAAFGKVKTFFQTKDELHSILLTRSLLEDFKVRARGGVWEASLQRDSEKGGRELGLLPLLGCQALSEMIQFYLEEVMPQAENEDPDIKQHVNSLGEKLKTLRLRLRRCHRFLPCENKSKVVEQVKSTFSKLQEKGVYKAMGEFDIFINYIEAYMTMKMKI